jgi:hypothetical protein
MEKSKGKMKVERTDRLRDEMLEYKSEVWKAAQWV